MKKLRLLYLIICILLILFFCTACIFTQCSKAFAGLLLKTNTARSNDFTGSSTSQTINDTIASASEETDDRGNTAESVSSSTEWDDYNSSGISGEAINFKIAYEFLVTGDTESIMFITCIPSDYKYRQKIKDYGFSARPDRIFTDDGNSYATFKLINPVNKYFISMDIQMELFDFDLLAAQKNPGNLDPGGTEDGGQLLAEYLVPEEHLESDDPQIGAVADSFNSNTGQLELVNRIYSFVLDRMQYAGYNPSDVGAAAALESGSGDCTEYSDLFVALCRAKGIPARVIEGYAADAGPDDLRFGHNWAEAFLDDFGWVPFDPIYDDNNGSSPETTFENLQNIYIYTGFKRNDETLAGYHYYAYNYHGDPIEVKKTVVIN
jgi:transglutaminase-like putative cysteine protease